MPSKRIIIPIPNSNVHTRIETYHDGKLNRVGGVTPGVTETKIKLPGDAELEDCLIRVIPDYPNQIGYIFDGELKPFEPIMMDHPAVIGDRYYEPLKEEEVTDVIIDDEVVIVIDYEQHKRLLVAINGNSARDFGNDSVNLRPGAHKLKLYEKQMVVIVCVRKIRFCADH